MLLIKSSLVPTPPHHRLYRKELLLIWLVPVPLIILELLVWLFGAESFIMQ